jgi:hypothetical protein
MNKLVSMTAVALLFAASGVSAAPVGSVKATTGLVMADQGTNRQTAVVDMPLNEGDRLLTGADASATVKYNDGCDVNVPANSIFTLTIPSVCGGGLASIQTFATSPIAAGGFAFNSALIGLGGLAAVGAIAATSNNNDTPASPQ